jgi:hypothetical protein
LHDQYEATEKRGGASNAAACGSFSTVPGAVDIALRAINIALRAINIAPRAIDIAPGAIKTRRRSALSAG